MDSYCKIVVVSLLLGVSKVLQTDGFPTGAPPGACGDLTPGHGHEPQTSPLPYKLILDNRSVRSGGTVRLIISSLDRGHKGFLVEGRKVGGDTTPQGVFEAEGNQKIVECGHNGGQAITHSNNDVKQETRVTWVAPTAKGKYHLLVSVVQDYSTFWVGNPTEEIEVQ